MKGYLELGNQESGGLLQHSYWQDFIQIRDNLGSRSTPVQAVREHIARIYIKHDIESKVHKPNDTKFKSELIHIRQILMPEKHFANEVLGRKKMARTGQSSLVSTVISM